MLMKKIIFTDLDGTLLDERYSFEKALPALKLINKYRIPLIFCTSKTRAETELYRRKTGNSDPFIVENGGAVFIPENYFDFEFEYNYTTRNYLVIKLGTDYVKLRRVLESIRNSGIRVVGFGDMSPEEISKCCNMPLEQARLAKEREYDEPFRLAKKEDEEEVSIIIRENGLSLTKGGTFYHLTGGNDKGKAVKILTDLYSRKYGKIMTYGFGNSENDFEMLEAVDEAYIIQKADGSFASCKFNMAEGIGPAGWNMIVLRLFKWA